MSSSTHDLLRSAWSRIPATVVVAIGAAVGVGAWLGARLMSALGAAPAVGALVAVALMVAVGAGVLERGLHAAIERWLGGSWSPLAVGGAAVARLVALWSIAPRAWLGALVLAAVVGRWAAIGLQCLGDVAVPTGRGRTLVVAAVGWAELAVLSVVVVALAVWVAGPRGVATLILAGLVAGGLGVAVQVRERELAGDSLAAIATAVELVVLVGLSAALPASRSPFVS